jgi:hypothetical protein
MNESGPPQLVDRTLSKKDEKIFDQMKKRFKRGMEYESFARKNYIADVRFAEGDSVNMNQWSDTILKTRGGKPSLTVNKTRQHNLLILNEQRQNKSSVKIRPVGNDATTKAAEIFEGLIRHIQDFSNANEAYDCASYCQIYGGMGYWRILTDYVDEESFDQEIFIHRIDDPLTVLLDPDTQTYEGSDARWGFIFQEVSIDQMEEDYPGIIISNNTVLDVELYTDSDHIIVAEYFRKVNKKKEKLHQLKDGSIHKKSDLKDMAKSLLAEQTPDADNADPSDISDLIDSATNNVRDIQEIEVEWFKIVGDQIVERSIWPGKYIPIVRVIGEETKVGDKVDRKGHTRALIDIQKIFNIMVSTAIEEVALQTKVPYMITPESIEGYESIWAEANISNPTFLPYNFRSESGEELPKPERIQPPMMAQGYLEGVKMMGEAFKEATGQYQAVQGMNGNETSAKAITTRQRQSETSTAHYVDHLSQSIRYTGLQLLDLIPKVYDTKRVAKILNWDGSRHTIQIDPDHPDAHTQVQDTSDFNYDPNAISIIFNPTVGDYAVYSDVGPDYASQREEFFNMFSTMVPQSPKLMEIAGDLLFKAADVPFADEIAARIRRTIPSQITSDGPVQNPQMDQAHQLIQQQQTMLEQLQKELKDQQIKQATDTYKAQTDRMAVAAKVDPAAMEVLVRSMVQQILGESANINQVIQQHQQQTQPDQGEPNVGGVPTNTGPNTGS